jgi:glycine cleavage system aminomethyltransferase T
MSIVDSKKGCYIGQEVIARLETYDKVQRQFCGFIFSSPIEDFIKYNLYDDSNEDAGIITSSVYSYKFKKHLGIGFVKRKYFEDGITLSAKNGGQNPIQVSVKKLPFKK